MPTPLSNDNWTPCQPGDLVNVVDKLRRRKQMQKTASTLRTAAAIVAGVFIGWGVWQFPAMMPEPNFGGIVCSEVRANSQAFAMQQLAPDVATRIRNHMERCPACQKLFRDMQRMPSGTVKAALEGDIQPHDTVHRLAELAWFGSDDDVATRELLHERERWMARR